MKCDRQGTVPSVAVSASPASRRNSGLDALRAVSIGLVILRHFPQPAYPISAPLGLALELISRMGWVGVDIFFVTSGFLVSQLLFSDLERTGDLRVSRFLLRRGFKIYPAYYLFTFINFGLAAFSNHPMSVGQLSYEVFFVQNYFQGPVIHTWSLAVEEHFYLFLPILLLGLMRLERAWGRKSLSTLPWAILLLNIGVLVFRFRNDHIRQFSLLTHHMPTHLRIDSLLFGVVLSYYRKQIEVHAWVARRGMRLIAGLIGSLCFLPALLFAQDASSAIWTWGYTLIYFGSGLFVVLAWTTRSNNRLVGLLAKVGFYSYSIYLWHTLLSYPPVTLLMRVGVTDGLFLRVLFHVGVTIVGGIALARLIELPFLRLRDRLVP